MLLLQAFGNCDIGAFLYGVLYILVL